MTQIFYNIFKDWCKENDEIILPKIKFHSSLVDKDFRKYTNTGTCFRGINIKDLILEKYKNKSEEWKTLIDEKSLKPRK